MSFSIKKQGDVVVVDVEGQLIVGNRQELKQKVLDELERGEKKFLIDFTQTGGARHLPSRASPGALRDASIRQHAPPVSRRRQRRPPSRQVPRRARGRDP